MNLSKLVRTAFIATAMLFGINAAAHAEICADGKVISWSNNAAGSFDRAREECHKNHGGIVYQCFDGQGCQRDTSSYAAAPRAGVKYCTESTGAGNKGSAPLPYCGSGSSYSRQAWEEWNMTCAQKAKLGYISKAGCESGAKYATTTPAPATGATASASTGAPRQHVATHGNTKVIKIVVTKYVYVTAKR